MSTDNTFSRYLASIRLLLQNYLLLILIFTIGRVVLFVYYHDRIVDADVNIWLTFLYGLRLDTLAACVFLLPAALLLHFTPSLLDQFAGRILRLYLLLVLVIAVFMENATLPFINEYDVRPNIIFVNYLKYPEEVLPTLWATHSIELVLAFVMMAIAGILYYRKTGNRYRDYISLPLAFRLVVFVPVFIVLFIGIRSSFGHRPANPSDAIFSNNRLLNEITKNTLHSVIYAAASEMKHGGSSKQYGSMQTDEALQRVRASLRIGATSDDAPTRRIEKTHFPADRPKNLVIILEESLGAQFVETADDQPVITPYIRKLQAEGIVFKRLYSNGTRSVRGIAGIVSGIAPIPGNGVVKRSLSQKDFFTVANLLKPYGYASSFYYGGESRFDNMKSWFSGNGFDKIVDEGHFDDSVFHGTWGVDDLSVLERAHQDFEEMGKAGQPFVSVIFSTSNHQPFDFPADRIELVPGVAEKSVENAVKYADYAIGKYIELAKQSSYYDDTVFLIVADHNIRTFGDDIIPVHMFHIPALILGGSVEHRQIDSLTSQPDVIATALDLTGLDLTIPVMGRSVFSADRQPAVLMKFHDIYGLMRDGEVAVIQPDKAPETFVLRHDDHLVAAERNADLELDALAYIITLDTMYQQQLYK